MAGAGGIARKLGPPRKTALGPAVETVRRISASSSFHARRQLVRGGTPEDREGAGKGAGKGTEKGTEQGATKICFE